MSPDPTASVVIPTYNRADVLPRAIDSALAQTITDIEVIVVDDASTDSTPELVESYSDGRLDFYRHDGNKGGAAARNTGIRAATGKYIGFLDSDDKWHPTKLRKQISCLEDRSKEWIAAYTDYQTFGPSEHPTILARLSSLLPSQKPSLPIEGGEEIIPAIFMRQVQHGGTSSLLVEHETTESIGGFDESFERYQDIEFLIRIAKQGKIAYIDEKLFTKELSATPSAAVGEAAQRKLFDKFADEIESLESEGYDVTGNQRCVLARAYLKEGELYRGLQFIYGSNPRNIREYVILTLLIIRALRTSLLNPADGP